MKIKLALLFAVILLVLAKFTYDQFVPPFAKGEKAPEFSLSDLDGNTVRLADFNGTPVLIHFWATWCTQCVEEMSILNSFANVIQDVKILAVSEDEGGTDAVLNFLGAVKPSFTILLDSEGRVADKYKSYKIPETYLLDKEGKVLHRFVGAVSWDNPQIAQFIKKTISENPQNNQ